MKDTIFSGDFQISIIFNDVVIAHWYFMYIFLLPLYKQTCPLCHKKILESFPAIHITFAITITSWLWLLLSFSCYFIPADFRAFVLSKLNVDCVVCRLSCSIYFRTANCWMEYKCPAWHQFCHWILFCLVFSICFQLKWAHGTSMCGGSISSLAK